nr:MAG TPA: hypothetical protein [Caudoviricetes sp.]
MFSLLSAFSVVTSSATLSSLSPSLSKVPFRWRN